MGRSGDDSHGDGFARSVKSQMTGSREMIRANTENHSVRKMKITRFEIHLDPPLDSAQGITKENHQLLELFFLAPQHIGEWFLKLPDIQDRMVVNFIDSKYHSDTYREMIVELLREAQNNSAAPLPDDLRDVMHILSINDTSRARGA